MSGPALNPAVADPAAARLPRTAVLVIHGVGNQRPLETLRNAADAIYATDPAMPKPTQNAPALWLSYDRDDPDHDLDLPMLTTADIATGAGEPPHYVDFHECYWAPIMSEARFVAVPLWLFELIRKGPRFMRSTIRALWPIVAALIDLWLAAFAFLLLSAAFWITGARPGPNEGAAIVWASAALAAYFLAGLNAAWMMAGVFGATWLFHALGRCVTAHKQAVLEPLPYAPGSAEALWTALIFTGLFVLINTYVLLTVAGDAARYYRSSPANIAVRRAARKLAVDRLRDLHRDNRYDRVIVVAHSLGTVIGYDMLRAYWSEICTAMGDPAADPLFVAQDKVGAPVQDDERNGIVKLKTSTFDAARWREAKAMLRARLSTLPDQTKRPHRWIVSDFVTLGSPLTHAAYLMTDGTSRMAQQASFHRKRAERELPQDPAWHVGGDGALIFRSAADKRGFLHTGALFGVTRWTNLYFPLRATLFGDLVGGRVADAFGEGVDDVRLSPTPRPAYAAHVEYFDTRDPTAPHLMALRRAVDLSRARLAADLAKFPPAPPPAAAPAA